MTIYFVRVQRINFAETLSVLTTTLFLIILKHLLKTSSVKILRKIESYKLYHKISKSKLINSASEHENNWSEESETSDDEYLLDLTKLQPYRYEPCVSKEPLKEICPEKESSDSQQGISRIGNTLWCYCGKCKSKATYAESIYCLDKEENLKSYFEGRNFYQVLCNM